MRYSTAYNKSYSSLIGEFQLNDDFLHIQNGREKRSNLQEFGDLFIVEHTGLNTYEHVAFHIDGDLYFEKTGTNSEFLYRLVSFEDMISSYPPRENRKYIIRRFNKKPLPRPEDAFSLKGGKDKIKVRYENEPGELYEKEGVSEYETNKESIIESLPEKIKSQLTAVIVVLDKKARKFGSVYYQIVPIPIVYIGGEEKNHFQLTREAFKSDFYRIEQ